METDSSRGPVACAQAGGTVNGVWVLPGALGERHRKAAGSAADRSWKAAPLKAKVCGSICRAGKGRCGWRGPAVLLYLPQKPGTSLLPETAASCCCSSPTALLSSRLSRLGSGCRSPQTAGTIRLEADCGSEQSGNHCRPPPHPPRTSRPCEVLCVSERSGCSRGRWHQPSNGWMPLGMPIRVKAQLCHREGPQFRSLTLLSPLLSYLGCA